MTVWQQYSYIAIGTVVKTISSKTVIEYNSGAYIAKYLK